MPVKHPAAAAHQLHLWLARPRLTAAEDTAAETGRLLRTTRERMGLSRADVNHALRISRTQIAHMESGRFGQISSVPALRDGHIRAYVRYLDLDLQPIMDAVHQQSAGDAAANPEPLYPPPPRRNPLAYVMMGMSMIILVLLIMAWDRLSTVQAYLPVDGTEAPARGSLAAAPPNSFRQIWSGRRDDRP